MITFPNAKINIGLNIVDKRNDGFHNLQTVFYPIKINDSLELIETTDKTQISIYGIPVDGNSDDNLCIKAYKLLKQDFDLPPVHLHLLKHIPIGAGLGGGSADAAFTLMMLNDYFNLSIPKEKLQSYAQKLGSDCAFFINNKPVYAIGRGDEFRNINLDLSQYYIVVVKPDIHISTVEAYRNCKPQHPEKPLTDLLQLPIEQWKDNIYNAFETTVSPKYPEIANLKQQLYDFGAVYASMSGSGSALFGIFRNEVVLKDIEKTAKVFYGV